MNRLIIIPLIIFVPLLIWGQTGKVQLKYEPSTQLIKPDADDLNFKRGKTYRFEMDSLNTAVYQAIVKFDSRSYQDPLPDMLKEKLPFLAGIELIAESGHGLESSNPLDYYNYFQFLLTRSDTALARLELIYQVADELYKQVSSNKISIQEQQAFAKNTLAQWAGQWGEATLPYNQIVNNKDASKREIAQEEWKGSRKLTVENISAYLEGELAFVEQADQLTTEFLASPSSLNTIGVGALTIIQMINTNNRLATRKKERYRRAIQFLLASQTAQLKQLSPVFTAGKDVVEMNLKLVNRWTGDTIVKKKLDYHTFGGVAFNFSTGFFADNLPETAYYLSAKDSDTNYVMEEEGRSVEPALGALLHISFPINPKLKVGPVLGAAVSPLNGKTRYLIGGSGIWGTKKLFSISAGLSMTELSVLSNRVEFDTENNQWILPSSVSAIPTYKKLSMGWFVGVTFNLTRK